MRKGSTVGEAGFNGLLRNSSSSGFPCRPPELILRFCDLHSQNPKKEPGAVCKVFLALADTINQSTQMWSFLCGFFTVQ